MPELSDVILSKIELIRLISSVLKINRSAMTITNISTSSITVIPDIYFLSVKNLRECETFSVNNVLEGLLW